MNYLYSRFTEQRRNLTAPQHPCRLLVRHLHRRMTRRRPWTHNSYINFINMLPTLNSSNNIPPMAHRQSTIQQQFVKVSFGTIIVNDDTYMYI